MSTLIFPVLLWLFGSARLLKNLLVQAISFLGGFLTCLLAVLGFAVTSIGQMACWLGITTVRKGVAVGEAVVEAVSPPRKHPDERI